ncbi:glycosyltransferase [Cohnella boryungensis]|uniref:Glycosyltransferase n=2 Tax=Cohnella boryungensis TaxID=768479 RepID=A0ABV8S788_9BACL
MIVKNEEAVLDRCLQSVSRFVDEIVIVDTGSSDSTKEIARKYTNKIYDFKWINDFAAARNESLKYATGRFILVMDADEFADESNMTSLRNFLSNQKPLNDTLYRVTVVSYKEANKPATEEPILRVFANHMNIRYVRPIHEQPTPQAGRSVKIVSTPIKILHSGYTEETIQSKNKHERNLHIFAEMQKKQQLSPYDQCMLGRQLLFMGRHAEALTPLLEAHSRGDKKEEWYKHNLVAILELYLNTNDLVSAYTFARDNLAPYFHYADIRSLYASVLYKLGFWKAAKKEFEEALAIADSARSDHKTSLVSSDLGFRNSIWHLVQLNENELNYTQAIRDLAKLLVNNKHDIEAINKFIQLSSIHEKFDQVLAVLEELLQTNTDRTAHAIVGKIAIRANHKELASHYCGTSIASGLFNLSEQLHYALLFNNEPLFSDTIRSLPEESLTPQIAQKIALGILVWNRTDWFIYLGKHGRLLSFIQHLLNHTVQEFAGEDLPNDTLIELYNLQQWDAYEFVLSQYETTPTINRLANYFLAIHHVPTALQYYGFLTEQNAMTPLSIANLAGYQSSQGNLGEACSLWEQAIALEPSCRSHYIHYYETCEEPSKKQEIRQRLIAIEPAYSQLDFLFS